MANRPAFLCELDKGKLIDTQTGFVDTFNYAVRAIDNLEGGKNCEVDWTIPDHPVINVDIPENGGSGGGGGDVEAVHDVSADTQSSQSGITVSYTDDRQDKFIPFTGGGEVDFTGTNSTTTDPDSSFTFASAANSNVVVSCSGTTITIGVYYI